MDRVFAKHTSVTAPTLPGDAENGYPRGTAIGVSPTQVGPYWYHMMTESLRNVIVSAGLTPAPATLTLLRDAIEAMITAAIAAIPATDVGYPCRAWVNFDGSGANGTNQTIIAGGNVASVYKNGTGDYTIHFTTPLADANFAIGGCSEINSTVAMTIIRVSQTASEVRIQTMSYDVLRDVNWCSVAVNK